MEYSSLMTPFLLRASSAVEVLVAVVAVVLAVGYAVAVWPRFAR